MANLKIIAIVAVIVLVIAGVGVVLLGNSTEKRTEEIDFITGLESVGSGFYYRVGGPITNDAYLVTFDANGNAIYNAAHWGGLIIATPGETAIQHIQLKTIVEKYLTLVDGKTHQLLPWSEGATRTTDNVYYVAIANANILSSTTPFDAGTTWQPWLQKISDDSRYTKGVLTNDLFPHQTCCVTVVNKAFADENYDATVAVTWAIKEATDWLNEAKEKGRTNPNDPQYKELLRLANSVVGTTTFTEEEIAIALDDIEYAWGNEIASAPPLEKLRQDIALLTKDLTDINNIKVPITDLGYSSYRDFANHIVDDKFLVDVLENGKPGWTTGDKVTKVKFALIIGDLHKLPVHLANLVKNAAGKSFYEQVGIDFEEVPVALGNEVILKLRTGDVQFGVSGQPSVLTPQVNEKLAKA